MLGGRLAAHLGMRVFRAPFVLAVGSFFVDGEGTLLTTDMRKTVLASVPGMTALLLGTALVGAQQFGTAAEAKAMLERGVGEIKANVSAALAKFNDKENKQFRDRDLYVF